MGWRIFSVFLLACSTAMAFLGVKIGYVVFCLCLGVISGFQSLQDEIK